MAVSVMASNEARSITAPVGTGSLVFGALDHHSPHSVLPIPLATLTLGTSTRFSARVRRLGVVRRVRFRVDFASGDRRMARRAETRPRRAPQMAECLNCRRTFQPRRGGHVFCSSFCRHRHRGASNHGRPAADWHPSPDSGFPELDAHDTVGIRRHWYLTLIKEGLL